MLPPVANFDQNVRIIIIGLLLSACDFISVYRITPKCIIDFTFHEFNEMQDEFETSKYLRIILSYNETLIMQIDTRFTAKRI